MVSSQKSSINYAKFNNRGKVFVRDLLTHKEYVEMLNKLLDEVGDNESHPLFNFLEVLGTLIESYEEDHVKIPDVSAREVLRYLMEEHSLSQGDLSEVRIFKNFLSFFFFPVDF